MSGPATGSEGEEIDADAKAAQVAALGGDRFAGTAQAL